MWLLAPGPNDPTIIRSVVVEHLHVHRALALDAAETRDVVLEIGQIGGAELGDHVDAPTSDVIGDGVTAAMRAEDPNGDQRLCRNRSPAQRLATVELFDSIPFDGLGCVDQITNVDEYRAHTDTDNVSSVRTVEAFTRHD